VLGGSMRPEFDDGDIVVVEPEGVAGDGSFVIAHHGGEWMLRALQRDGNRWRLAALDPAIAPIAIGDLSAVRGVVIQKSRPGRRRATKRYVE
jgi:SOS-response transcriptional repressor LexA